MKLKMLIALLLPAMLVFAQHKGGGEVKVLQATVQDGIRGASPGGGSTVYTLKVKIMTGKPVVFKNLWIDSVDAPFEVQAFKRNANAPILQGDSVLLVYRKSHKPAAQPLAGKPLPRHYKGAAMVEYTVGGRLEYFVIEKFERLAVVKGE